MRRQEPRTRSTARTATWFATGVAALGAAALLVRRLNLAPLRALVGVRYDEASGRGRPATPPSGVARGAGHETLDMRGGLMAKLVLLLGSVAVCMICAMVGLRLWVTSIQQSNRPALTSEQTALITPPEPHLQRDPLGDIAQQRRGEDDLLDAYAYLDAGHTHARIPIGRAMALTAGQPLAPPP